MKNQVEFYDARTRKKLYVDEKRVAKTTATAGDGRVLYGLRTKTEDGRMLTKYVSKSDWEKAGTP